MNEISNLLTLIFSPSLTEKLFPLQNNTIQIIKSSPQSEKFHVHSNLKLVFQVNVVVFLKASLATS